MHLGEILLTNEFKQYDYGSDDENQAHYGQSKPPMINLNKIPEKVPINMFVCREDDFSTPIAAIKSMNDIGPAVVSYTEREQCDHCSFNIGRDQSYLDDVLEIVNKANNYWPSSDKEVSNDKLFV